MIRFLDGMSDEAFWMLICVGMFMALLTLLYLGNELFEWAARRKEEKAMKERSSFLKGKTPHLNHKMRSL